MKAAETKMSDLVWEGGYMSLCCDESTHRRNMYLLNNVPSKHNECTFCGMYLLNTTRDLKGLDGFCVLLNSLWFF